MKINLIAVLFCLIPFLSYSQENYVFSVLPINKSTDTHQDIYQKIEQLIWQKLIEQERFPVLDSETKTLKTKDDGTVERTESGQAIAATHLIQFNIAPYIFNSTQIPANFEKLDFRVEMEAQAEIEMEVFDVATGAIVTTEKFRGEGGVLERIEKIPLTKTLWSKEKGLHSVNKTSKEIEEDKSAFLKKYKEWQIAVKEKSIDRVILQLDQSFRRLFLPEITVVEIAEESKGKAQKVVISEGDILAFGKKEKIEVVVISFLEFEGEKIKREKKLGELKFLEANGGQAVCKVSDGKEEIFTAFKKGEKLICKID